MLGLMQDRPLLISSIMTHAATQHGEQEIVSNTIEGGVHRYTYADCEKRTKKLANALTTLGAEPGDRVATLAWNGYRHLEIYYATSGNGTVCHTINPRLFPEQVAYIAGHAGDKFIFVDLNIYPLVEALADHLKTVKGVVIMTDEDHMPEIKIADKIPVHCYETLLAAESDQLEWPQFDENTASSMCYTSGTTGNPKGVLYSHRSTLLHALSSQMKDASPLGSVDVVLPVVPMFHANAWGAVYSVLMVGAKLVLPGILLDGENLTKTMNEEKVTASLGVPTIWLGLLTYLRQSGERLDTINAFLIGGAACPLAIIEGFGKEYGIAISHGWGMTELSPLGTVNQVKAGMNLTDDELYQHQLMQGRAVYGFEMKIVGEDGNELPHDGKTFGRLLSRGYWVVSEYYKDDEHPNGLLDADGWFDTGDVATIDERGFMQITDRTKDVIKSGGEWISSIDLENIAVSHPAVASAGVIAVPHPKWDERPLLVVAKAADAEITTEEILAFYDGKIASWMKPDDVVYIDEMPLGATGKILKTKLRELFGDHKLPTA